MQQIQTLNRETELRLAMRSPKAVSVTVGKYHLPRWSLEYKEQFNEPLLKHMQADHWDEKQAWLDEQGIPYEILTHSYYSTDQDAAVVHVVLLTESENATMFALRFGR